MKRNCFVLFLVGIFFVMSLLSAFSAEKTELRIGTSRIAGSYQLWGSTWAKVIVDNVEGVTAGIEATAGPVANIQLIEEGINSLGFVSAISAHEAWNGVGWADGKKYHQIRSVFAMYPSFLQLITIEKRNIKNLSDFEGKKVDVGMAGSTPDISMGYVKDVLGINYTLTYNDVNVAIEALKQGTIDVFARVTGLPNSSIMDLSINNDVYIVWFKEEELRQIISTYPYFGTGVIPPNIYRKQDYEVDTIAVWAFAVCDKDLSEDIVYKITKAAFENQETFIQAHPDGKYLIPKNVNELNVPLHPGALKYYREVGQEIPEELVY